MTRKQIFDAWAPQSARWSNWVKPVVFAHLREGMSSFVGEIGLPEEPAETMPHDGRIPPADGNMMIVVDLAGEESVRFSLFLASTGYRPVPLFNSVPGPNRVIADSHVIVNMRRIADALEEGASILNKLSLSPNAPPAFCLDARRRTGDGMPPSPGVFDNRSINLPADFPSANLLRSEGVNSAMVILTGDASPARDLCHTLRRWQEAGIELSLLRLDSDDPPQPLIVRRPPMFGQLWYGFLAALGLRPNLLGGYGGYLPDPSAG